jgi:misacylated tRNA(Ala) deacylase
MPTDPNRTELLCQRDAYLATVTTQVITCRLAGDRFEVLPAKTVLYPEGGGQPADRGTLGGQPVLELRRGVGGALWHVLEAPAEGEVAIALDWARRYDHMQQHTAQHLLTALAQDRHGLATCAFHLGAARSDIELDGETSDELLAALEREANRVIREDRRVSVEWVEVEELSRLEGVRSRGLPDELDGPVRLVSIEGTDRNTCGGTHVARTAELQALKLVATERMRGGTRLHYVAGGRVLGELGAALSRERALSGLLSCGPPDHGDAVTRLLAEQREQRRERRRLVGELAVHLGRALAAEPGVAAALHREEADMELLRGIARAVDEEATRPRWVLVTGGGTEGLFALLGPADQLRAVGAKVAELLGGKGGGSGELYQGKASRLDRRAEAARLLSNEPG